MMSDGYHRYMVDDDSWALGWIPLANFGYERYTVFDNLCLLVLLCQYQYQYHQYYIGIVTPLVGGAPRV